jgi:hypothetical protein
MLQPFFSLGKEPLIPTEYKAHWALDTAWILWRKEKIPAPAFEPKIVQPVAYIMLNI